MPRQSDENPISPTPFLAPGGNSEVRTLNYTGSAPERRDVELRSVSAGGASVVTYITASDATLLESARRRLTYLAAALAGLALVHGVAMYITGLVVISTAVEELRRDMPADLKKKIELPGMGEMLVGGGQRLLWALAMSMCVPICGYYGVKQSDTRLLGCFSCCSCCGAFSMSITLLIAIGGILFAENVEPLLEPWFQKCDPAICLQLPTMNQTIDCLAGDPRRVVYTDIPHLPESCPQAFLKCSGPPGDGCLDPFNADGPCQDDERRAYCDKLHRERGCEFLGRCIWYDRYNAAGSCEPVGLPYDPTLTCEVMNQHVEAFHVVEEALPGLSQRLVIFLAMKITFTAPVLCLSCLGICWGWSLLSALNAGYSTVGEDTTREIPQASVQEMALRPPNLQMPNQHVQPLSE